MNTENSDATQQEDAISSPPIKEQENPSVQPGHKKQMATCAIQADHAKVKTKGTAKVRADVDTDVSLLSDISFFSRSDLTINKKVTGDVYHSNMVVQCNIQ